MIIIVAEYLMENNNGRDWYKFRANTPKTLNIVHPIMSKKIIMETPYVWYEVELSPTEIKDSFVRLTIF